MLVSTSPLIMVCTSADLVSIRVTRVQMFTVNRSENTDTYLYPRGLRLVMVTVSKKGPPAAASKLHGNNNPQTKLTGY